MMAMALAFLFAGETMAVPAYPGKMRIQQPDGSYITIRLQGDEHFHMSYTEDGYPLLRNEQTGLLEYAQVTGGKLLASGIRATEAAERTVAAKAFLQSVSKDDVAAFFQTSMLQKRAEWNQSEAAGPAKAPAKAYGDTRLRISDVPSTGHRKALAILVQFPETKFSSKVGDANAFYTDLLNKENYSNEYGATGSAHDFYAASSYGLYDPEFTVVGPVTMSQSESYYAGSDGTSNVAELVHEAAQLVDDQVDFSQYDTDGDGYVDNIYVFYAGYGQADSYKTYTIWPHNWSIAYGGYNLRCDGVIVNRYAISQELLGYTSYGHQYGDPVAIGTFVHEFGHVLGIPDLYNTVNSSTYTLGEWSTMCSASYLDDQCTPPLYSAYERYALGWSNPTELKNTDTAPKTLTAAEDGDASYVIKVPGKDSEYFLFENRQQTGWDRYLPGHGMLVWHIDEDEVQWYSNTPNNNGSHQYVELERADDQSSAYSETADPFPGTKNVTVKDFTTWDGVTLFGIEGVAEKNDVITFSLNENGFTLERPEKLTVDEVLGRSAVANWTAVENAKTYRLELRQGGETLKNVETAALNWTMDDLTPETEYEVRIVAAADAWASDTLSQTFTTTQLQWMELSLMAHEATDVDSTAFTANWEAIEGTDEYRVTLYDYHLSDTESSLTYDFSSRIAGMPEGWSCQGGKDMTGIYVKGRGLRLRRTDDVDKPYLCVSRPDGKLTGVSFTNRTTNAANTITIEVYRDSVLAEQKEVALSTSSTLATTTFTCESCDSIRLVFNDNTTDASSSYVGIDDVTITFYDSTPVAIANKADLSAGTETSYTFTGLNSLTKYAYTVVAVKGTEQTQTSNLISVTTLRYEVSGIDNVWANEGGTVEVFDLQGRRISGKQLPGGLYIIRQNGLSKKVLVK